MTKEGRGLTRGPKVFIFARNGPCTRLFLPDPSRPTTKSRRTRTRLLWLETQHSVSSKTFYTLKTWDERVIGDWVKFRENQKGLFWVRGTKDVVCNTIEETWSGREGSGVRDGKPVCPCGYYTWLRGSLTPGVRDSDPEMVVRRVGGQGCPIEIHLSIKKKIKKQRDIVWNPNLWTVPTFKDKWKKNKTSCKPDSILFITRNTLTLL